MNEQQANGPFSGAAEAFFQSANSYEEVLQRIAQSDVVFFDFETTGIDKSRPHDSAEHFGYPVQIGMVRIRGGAEVGRFMSFMNPGFPLSSWSLKTLKDRHGHPLTDAWLATQPPYNQVLSDAMAFLGATSIVGGQNCQFDVAVMRHSLKRMGELEQWRVSGHVDSCFIAKAVFRGQPACPPNFKLETLAAFFGLPAFAAHDAAEDSLASWCVLRATLERGQVLQDQGAWGRLPALPPLVTPNVTLSAEQLQLQQRALQGRNMFITGGAGTGKSFLLTSIVAKMHAQRGQRSCVVLSPTGAAAVLVKGRTIHSFFNLGKPSYTWASFLNIQTGRNSAWLKTDLTCIIFDEISMVSAEMLDLIDAHVRAARARPDQPFGGLQVIMFGDFFQLPPIWAKDNGGGGAAEVQASSGSNRPFMNTGFAFESHFWKQLQPEFCNLKRSFRQKDDQPFLNALERIRFGELNPEDRQLLCAPKVPRPTQTSDIVPTKLFSHGIDVRKANAEELAKLPGHQVSFCAHDSKPIYYEIQPPEVLDLKVGAQVMLVKNLDVQKGLVNGSRGVVVGFQTAPAVFPVEQGHEPSRGGGDDVDVLSQAVASVALQDIDPTPECCVSLQGDIRQSVQSGVSLHPIVRFEGAQQLQTMPPRDFEFDENAYGQCSFRRQIPLTLAWALSIHKAQGMSISNLEVTCEDVWQAGQIYVALSRGRTLQGLTVHSLGRDGLCRADARVVAFYASCEHGAAHALHTSLWTDDSTIAGIRLAAMSR